jgi:hypothetical protein
MSIVSVTAGDLGITTTGSEVSIMPDTTEDDTVAAPVPATKGTTEDERKEKRIKKNRHGAAPAGGSAGTGVENEENGNENTLSNQMINSAAGSEIDDKEDVAVTVPAADAAVTTITISSETDLKSIESKDEGEDQKR